MERAVANDARWETSNGGARTYTDAAGNLAGAAIGHSGSAQDGKLLGGSEGLRGCLSSENRQCNKGKQKSREKRKTA
jgi:hypothetical protein